MSHVLLLMCLLAQSDTVPAANPAAETSAIDGFKQEASEYVIQLRDDASLKLTLDPKPVLHWSNPARTAEDGAVFLWLKDGRPEVIGTIFTYKLSTVRRKHEFHSLSTEPLTAVFNGKTAWKPRLPGVIFKPIPKAPVPADNSRLRQLQMKSLSKEFSATMKNLEGESFELRLMPQPLHRYEPPGGKVLDGSLFSFALGTDPEVLLLIEARQNNDAWQWQYALARFNYYELMVSHNNETVWRVNADPTQANHDLGDATQMGKVYSSFHVK